MIQNLKNAIIIIIVTTAISFALVGAGFLNQPDLKLDFTSQYHFVKATSNSPIIEINFNSTQELMQEAQKLNTTTIYDTNQGLMVIDTTTGIGYVYSVPQTWFGFPAMPTTFLGYLPFILGVIIIFGYDDTPSQSLSDKETRDDRQ
jgi:hypothetical protein